MALYTGNPAREEGTEEVHALCELHRGPSQPLVIIAKGDRLLARKAPTPVLVQTVLEHAGL